MNAATAGGVLGGTITRTATKKSKNGDDGTCEFLRQQGRRPVYAANRSGDDGFATERVCSFYSPMQIEWDTA